MKRKKTKIICTLGPASEKVETIKSLVEAGMDCVRLNFSHGSYDIHSGYINNIRQAAKEKNVLLPILQDISGPKIRVGLLENQKINLEEGGFISITNKEITGNEKVISTTYKEIVNDVTKGEIILLDDGNLKLQVAEIKKDEIVCKILAGGILKERKGINLPDTNISLPTLTEKDKKDIEFGIIHNVNFIALSFVRSPDDILMVKKILEDRNYNIPVIAKIERPEAIKRIDEIIEVSDIIMVARGDLGVEVSPEDVPVLQKMIIRKCNIANKPVITATQMLESMITSSFPTRAETTDVANAILDGTDCVMLSAESSVGEHPVLVVETMSRIIRKTEEIKKPIYANPECSDDSEENELITICNSAVEIADSIGAKAIFTLTKTGTSPLLLSSHRPNSNIIAAAYDLKILMKSILLWGVEPIKINEFDDIETVQNAIIKEVREKEIVKTGDKVVLIYSLPIEVCDSANTIQIAEVN